MSVASYIRLKDMVQKYTKLKTEDRNFDARNDPITSGALVDLIGEGKSKSGDRK